MCLSSDSSLLSFSLSVFPFFRALFGNKFPHVSPADACEFIFSASSCFVGCLSKKEEMAVSRYEYVRAFEDASVLLPDCLYIVRVDGCRFSDFTQLHGFEKPNDHRGLQLMSCAALHVMRELGEVVLAYGHSDEYRYGGKALPMWAQEEGEDFLSLSLKKAREHRENRHTRFFSILPAHRPRLYMRSGRSGVPPPRRLRATFFSRPDLLFCCVSFRRSSGLSLSASPHVKTPARVCMRVCV